MLLRWLPFAFTVVACIPDATGGGSSGAPPADGGDQESGSSDGATLASPERAAVCETYAQKAAACCAAAPQGACSSRQVADFRNYCLSYARSCTGMPTCFSGTDCNTLLYCASAC